MRKAGNRNRRLTHAGVERVRYDANQAEAGPGSRMVLRDTEIPGLQLRITPNGAKTFSVYFRPPSNRTGKRGTQLKGKQTRITLGRFPAMSLAEARQQANEIIGATLKGCDPWAERKKANKERYTNLFESVAQQFVAKKKEEIKSWAKIEAAFAHHVTPKWKGIAITDFGRRDARELIDGIKNKGTAREVRKHLHALFEWAVDEEIVSKNPIHERKASGRRKKNRLTPNRDAGRSLERFELKSIWHAADKLGYPFGPWFQLLMLTGQRRSDWSAASRGEIKPESELEQEDVRTAPGARNQYVLEIPPNRFKSERSHIVPLVPAAWQIIASLPVRQRNDYFLFSGREGETHISGYSKAKVRLDEQALANLREADPMATLDTFRIHDLRVSCRTRLAYLGIEEDIAEAVIGHARGLLSDTYNKHDYIAQKRSALTKYAEWLLAVVK